MNHASRLTHHGSINQRAVILLGTLLLAAGLSLAFLGTQPTSAFAPAAVEGKTVYLERCAICHGEKGDGKGPAADLMFPRPRDFTVGEFKIRTTDSSSPPTDADLINTISNGMPGSAMPAWKGILSQDEITAVAAYIKTFSGAFSAAALKGLTLSKRVNPDAASIQRGAQVYQTLQCFKCHGSEGRSDGPSALTLKDDYGQVIYPADLTQAWNFRGGGTANDIYTRIMTGLTGSPMPSFADALVDANGNPDEQKRWDLVNYVDSLSPDTAPEPQAAIIVKPVTGSIPDDPNAKEWQAATSYYYPLVGQIMREPRNFTPSIKGVWVRALYNAGEIAMLVQWDDRQQNTGANGEPADEVAVEFPSKPPEGAERPYFVYGDTDHPVNLWTWTAGAQAPVEQTGLGVSAITAQAKQNLKAGANYTAGRYSVIFHRALNTGDAADIALTPGVFVPISFSASDGLRGEKFGSGAISSWYQIYLDKPVPAINYVWIPIAILLAAFLEWWLVRLIRRRQKVA